MNQIKSPALPDDLFRQMIVKARHAGAEDQRISSVIHECADHWVTGYERFSGLALNDEERDTAIQAFIAAFFDPGLADKPNLKQELLKGTS